MSAHGIDMTSAREKLGGASLASTAAADLRVVTLDYVEGGAVSHIVLQEHVATLVEASKRLHFAPGVNPATGEATARIWRIRVAELRAGGPYWWSTPNLGNNGQPDGALIINEGIFTTAWIDEDHEVLA